MAGTVFELNPVQLITTGFVGRPGKRVFYLQAQAEAELVKPVVIS